MNEPYIPPELKRFGISDVLTGCCDDCGKEDTQIFLSEFGWLCRTCSLEYLKDDLPNDTTH